MTTPSPLRPPYSAGRIALLDATVRVVARRGLRGLTYRAVGTESGTTHALVSYHFGSRQNLVLAAARHASDRAVRGSALGEPGGDPETFAAPLPRHVAEHADIHAFLFELALEARRNPDLRPEVIEEYAKYRAVTQQSLRELRLGGTSPALARLVFAALDGLTLQQLIDGDESATGEAIATLQTLLRLLVAAEQSGA